MMDFWIVLRFAGVLGWTGRGDGLAVVHREVGLFDPVGRVREEQGQEEAERLGWIRVQELQCAVDPLAVPVVGNFRRALAVVHGAEPLIVRVDGIVVDAALAVVVDGAAEADARFDAGVGQQVVLAPHFDVVASFLEVAEDVGLVGLQQVPEGAVATDVRIPAGEHADS